MELASRAVGQDDGVAMSSPLLFDMIRHLSDEEHHEILDVLPARQGVLDLFSHLPCKLYLPGCADTLCQLDTDKLDTVTRLNRALVHALGFYKNTKASLDVIFLWDLPNYLDKRVLASLIDYLRPHMSAKVKLHIYIHTRQRMPLSPVRYSITGDGKVWVDDNTPATRACPLYYQEAIHTLLYPFKVNRSILLATGLQEYILTL